ISTETANRYIWTNPFQGSLSLRRSHITIGGGTSKLLRRRKENKKDKKHKNGIGNFLFFFSFPPPQTMVNFFNSALEHSGCCFLHGASFCKRWRSSISSGGAPTCTGCGSSSFWGPWARWSTSSSKFFRISDCSANPSRHFRGEAGSGSSRPPFSITQPPEITK